MVPIAPLKAEPATTPDVIAYVARAPQDEPPLAFVLAAGHDGLEVALLAF